VGIFFVKRLAENIRMMECNVGKKITPIKLIDEQVIFAEFIDNAGIEFTD
jgi:hypothetical protein